MAAPIVITVGREGDDGTLRFVLKPIEPIDRIWGAYNIEITFPSVGGTAKRYMKLTDFPRAAGIDYLASLLLHYWATKVERAGGVDPCFPGQEYPQMPSDEEMAQRPPTVGPVDEVGVSFVLQAGPAPEATAA